METKRKSAKVVASLLALAGLAVFSLFAVGGSLEPTAAPGPTMKTLDEVEPRIPIHASDLPLTITEPNSYYLVEDVDFTDDANNAITIECNDVTIDLMGFTLKGPDSGNKSGIYMYGRRNVEIRNGTIRDFGWPAISDNGFNGSSHRAVNIRALSNGYGIYLYGYGHLVKDCTAAENGNRGISAGAGSTVTGNTCYNNGNDGIYVDPGSTVTGNTCYTNGNEGIYADYASTVIGNTAHDNGSQGIYTGAGCTVTGNNCYSNGGNGIHAGSGCTVTGNTCCNNGDDGIDTSTGCTVTGNTATYNTADGIRVSYECKVIDNTCKYNGYFGDGAGIHAINSGNRIERNHVTLNDRGIDVDSFPNLIVKNGAGGNITEYDIVANNQVGTISADPTTAGPWDNFDF